MPDSIKLQHNFETLNLFIPESFKENAKGIQKYFKQMQVRVIITNNRLLLEPVSKDVTDFGEDNTIDGGIHEFIIWFEKQPSFVKGFFNVPLGQVFKIEEDK